MPAPLMVIVWGAAIAMVVLAAGIDAVLRGRRLPASRGPRAGHRWAGRRGRWRRPGVDPQRGTHRGAGEALAGEPGQRAAVRKLYGVQRAMHAEHSMFVAVGWYTADASQFGAQVGMTLVDGDGLLRIIAAGLDGAPLQPPRPDTSTTPACPECGSAMMRRMARRGPPAGEEFWGCSTFPTCRGTVPIHEDAAAAG